MSNPRMPRSAMAEYVPLLSKINTDDSNTLQMLYIRAKYVISVFQNLVLIKTTVWSQELAGSWRRVRINFILIVVSVLVSEVYPSRYCFDPVCFSPATRGTSGRRTRETDHPVPFCLHPSAPHPFPCLRIHTARRNIGKPPSKAPLAALILNNLFVR